jgi:hypothetical protein
MVFLLSQSFDRPQFLAIPQRKSAISDRPGCLVTIQKLVANHLDRAHLTDRLQDLPQQFLQPKPRKWAIIDYRTINVSQIVGIEPALFLAILQGTIDTEAPIQGYTHTSRQYLAQIHAPMATFVGGTLDPAGEKLQTMGLWELEERRHTPALLKIYQQLGGSKIQPTYREPSPYRSSKTPAEDLYRHGWHRIATEYGATCLYLWLMAHATGPLQQALGELCIDEVNHLTKFLGFGTWLYPRSWRKQIQSQPRKLAAKKSPNNLLQTYHRMMSVLHWPDWKWRHRWELVYTFGLVLLALWNWHRNLETAELEKLFGQGTAPLSTNV